VDDGKLHKTMLLMLRATMPGEIVAARDALLRVAQAEKYDVHTMAHELTGALIAWRASGKEKPDTKQMARFCMTRIEDGARVSDKENKFIEDMLGWRRPSPKQIDWLESIYERLKGTMG
jgi:hypothetical protein